MDRNAQERKARIGATRRVTLVGFVINLLLAIIKSVAGLLSGSQALIADGMHSVSDTATDVAVLIGVQYWSAPPDEEHPYGHGKLETLISSLIGIALACVGVGLIYNALRTLGDASGNSPGWSAFSIAVLSIIAKEAIYRWTANHGKKLKSPALIANAWHHRSDALSSIPVALAVLIAQVKPEWGFVDPIAAIVVSVLIGHVAWRIAWTSISQLLDSGADREDRKSIGEIAMRTEGVKAIHALRTRHIGPGLQTDIHILVDAELTVREGHDIAMRAEREILRDGPDVIDVLVHIEPYEP